MRAVALREHGGPEVLRLEELPEPTVGPGQVRVRVRACALNHLDLWVRRGLPNLRLTYPHVLGSDIAGEVEALGPGVEGIALGQRTVLAPGVSCGVCRDCLAGRDNLCRGYGILGETRSGGYAELVTVPAANVLPFPDGLDFAQASALPLTFQTAWQMLVERARVRPGETVLILAAGSGVGSAGVQIAKLFGATVIATASTAAKLEQARSLGADHVINHAEQGVVAEVRRITARRGVDVVFEHVGASTWKDSLLACARGGRIVTCGATSGFEAVTDLRHVFFRQLSILGSTMGSKSVLYDVLDHVRAGRLHPVVDRVLPLAEAAEAHRLLEERACFGKVVLLPS
jgi:NADPH:quinone reductase-like Zn-dependent oxidoreductase